MALNFGSGVNYSDYSQPIDGLFGEAQNNWNQSKPLQGMATDMYNQNVAQTNASMDPSVMAKNLLSSGWQNQLGANQQMEGFLPGTTSSNIGMGMGVQGGGFQLPRQEGISTGGLLRYGSQQGSPFSIG